MTTVVILWHDFSGMQSRFYGTLPNQQLQTRGCQESRGAATAHSSFAGHSIFEEVLSQLKRQSDLINYIQEQNDQALCQGEAAAK